MSLSQEMQATADEIRRNKSLVKSLQAERDLWKGKAMDAQEKLADLSDKDELSEEDRTEMRRQRDELDALNDELEGAAQENTKPEGSDSSGGEQGGNEKNKRIPPVGEEGHPTDAPTSGEVLDRNGPANQPAGGTVPLMPNMAFDPDPTGNRGVGSGQHAQPAAIETAGGFVVSGGGTTQRAPGSDPVSPSSTLVVQTDPDAKAAASNADLIKSGLGDSSQNATLGNDGQPVQDGSGMPREPSEAAQKKAQEMADLAEDERQRREENPLNLAPAGTPQAGSPEAEKEAQKRREEEQRAEQEKERQRNDAEAGKPPPGAPGPDPVSGSRTPAPAA